MNNLSGVYKITIGHIHHYIGSSVRLSRRECEHLGLLGKGKHGNPYMQKAWNKYQELTFEVLEYCDVDAVIALEQKYLDEVFGQEFCMNICSMAGSRLGVPHSDEVRKKMSANSARHKLTDAHKERLRYKRSPETIEKMKLAQQGRSPESCKKLSDSLKGREITQDARQKISKTLTGRRLTPEQKLVRKQKFDEKVANGWVYSGTGKTMSEEQKNKFRATIQAKIDAGWVSPKKGIPMSAEQKKNLSIAHTGKKLSAEHKAKISAATMGIAKTRKSVNL